MGVIKHNIQSVIKESIVNSDDQLDVNADTSSESDSPEDPLPTLTLISPCLRRRSRIPAKPENTARTPRNSKTGAKKQRHFDNINELLKLCTEEDFDEVSIDDFRPNSKSVFTRLLEEVNLMDAWNDFIKSNEDKQANILYHARSSNKNVHKLCDDNQAPDPEKAFQSINRDLRSILKQRHLPLGMVQSLEEQVTNFFLQNPQASYISEVLPGYQRLLLHALCQYNMLAAQSFNTKGERRVRVNNPKLAFVAPDPSLTGYLEKKLHNKSQMPNI